MILGIGSDLVDIRRIEKVLGDFEQRFMDRCFTAIEQQIAEKRRPGGTHIAAYAKRFAAKEAAAKALGTGFSDGILMKEIGVVNAANGAPAIELSGNALKQLKSITPDGHEAIIHISLSDEPPLAKADVIIEARAKD